MKSIEICKGLTLQRKKDGHWLLFDSNAGKHAGICLENNVDTIAGQAMLEWAKDMCCQDHELFGELNTDLPVVVLDQIDGEDFAKRCNFYIKEGYKLASSSCGFINSEDYSYSSCFQAILVKAS